MSMFYLIFFSWVLVSLSYLVLLGSATWCLQDFVEQSNRQFEQKTDRFWEFSEQTNSWVEVELPYDLVSCVNDNCTKAGLIDRTTTETREEHLDREYDTPKQKGSLEKKDGGVEENSDVVLPLRKRVSLTKMSETSIWVTGVSGSVYERFWNGVQWVIAPHDLPVSAGPTISVFMFNQTILALSEAGFLYQMQMSENSQPLWVEFMPALDQGTNKKAERNSVTQIKSGVVSYNGEKVTGSLFTDFSAMPARRVYFCTKNGLLLELIEVETPRWVNHGQPPGANVAAIADAASIRPEVVYTISSTGDLYEYDRTSKPSWKKHIWSKGTASNASLIPSTGCTIHGLIGDHSISLFLLTKGGNLIERRIQQRKWKWIVHGSPKDHRLTSITPVLQDESNEKTVSLFFTTSAGTIFEYQLLKHAGISQENQIPEGWLSHMHPPHAKVARGIPGLPLQVGRVLFPLDDGRLAELHLSGLGGENSGPTNQLNVRRKAPIKYVWSILDAPETEGWNAEYCTEDRGPMNCITGIKDEPNDSGTTRMARRRKASQAHHDYLLPSSLGGGLESPREEYNLPDNWINTNYRLRVMHGGRSFFFITDGGFTFEYLYAENVWLWLRHDHSTPMKGALGNYNGSLYVVDIYGSLLIRERNSNELGWINCTAMRKGRQVMGGPPWEGMTGKAMKVTAEDALFFVSKNGRLLQFTVALRKFKWKDCRHPPSTKVACIVDQEQFRENVVFVVGRNGRLYQYNKVTELWHEHYQSQHLIISLLPGTAMRTSSMSLTGSLFMLSQDGGLVEYHWNVWEGWNWVEHGAPDKGVTLVGSPGPCFEGNQLFLIGSDGKVYLRYMDQMTWRWKNCGFPHNGKKKDKNPRQVGDRDTKEEICIDEDFAASSKKEDLQRLNKNCNPKVAATRPIAFSEDSVVFELRDSRLAEMRRVEDKYWEWARTISTPTSSCFANYWTALAS
ncbi:hypothetical protein JRO89_XS10G0063100 [Xanthoceras sorbifolium]|uniref:Uncharacterized protein n=1 Tax=Xanthoceras sorbifolium TaxID=99658 RepID=A0ABQ8HHZ2_9ROSI|nr:hypothetical protein JRO89_XS10G0063100 [Xanthoceras sorbifolium]